tara:strand:+ start:373 stop:501 length:129 start_codon:yes stop_codon:yes gene_type:complete
MLVDPLDLGPQDYDKNEDKSALSQKTSSQNNQARGFKVTDKF